MKKDLFLWQKISGGFEYQYTSDGETYRSFGFDRADAFRNLNKKLGWDSHRFLRAETRKF